MSYVRPAGSSSITIEVFIPGFPSGRRSYPIEFEVDGRRQGFEPRSPGKLRVSLPLQALPSPALTEIRIRPCEASYASGYNHRIRPVVQSIRLDEISFKAAGAAADSVPPFGDLRSEGIDSDGWVLHRATLRVEAQLKSADLDIEFPAWAGLKECRIGVDVNSTEALRRVLTPGTHRLRVPLAGSGRASEITLKTDVSFALPKPDTRVRSFRLTAVRTRIGQ